MSIKFCYVQYLDKDTTEIIEVEKIYGFKCTSVDEFYKKYPSPPQVEVDWWDAERKDLFVVDCILYFVGVSKEDVQNQVTEYFLRNSRLRKPAAKIRANISDSESTISQSKEGKLKNGKLSGKAITNEKILLEKKAATLLEHRIPLNNDENTVAPPMDTIHGENEEEINDNQLSPQNPIIQERRDADNDDQNNLQDAENQPPQNQLDQLNGNEPKKFELFNGQIYINDAVSLSRDAWEHLELTQKDSILARNAAAAIWGEELPSKCFDLKAKARKPGQLRTLLEPQKLNAVYDIVARRLKKRSPDKHFIRSYIVKYCNIRISQKITDLNKTKITIEEIRNLRRFREEHENIEDANNPRN